MSDGKGTRLVAQMSRILRCPECGGIGGPTVEDMIAMVCCGKPLPVEPLILVDDHDDEDAQ